MIYYVYGIFFAWEIFHHFITIFFIPIKSGLGVPIKFFLCKSSNFCDFLVRQFTSFYKIKNDRKSVDPKDRFVLRSKFTVEYNVKGIPLNPFASIDYGCGMNYTANKWKYSVGADYTINKKHKLTLCYRFQTEDDDDEPNGHMLGLGYKIKL